MTILAKRLQNTMYYIEALKIDTKKQTGRLMGYKGRIIVLETLLLCQNIILLPLQIIGKPLAYIAGKVFPSNRKLYNVFPKSLISAIFKVICLPFCLILSCFLIWFNSYYNFQAHLKMNIIEEMKDSVIIQWHRVRDLLDQLKYRLTYLNRDLAVGKWHFAFLDSQKKAHGDAPWPEIDIILQNCKDETRNDLKKINECEIDINRMDVRLKDLTEKIIRKL